MTVQVDTTVLDLDLDLDFVNMGVKGLWSLLSPVARPIK